MADQPIPAGASPRNPHDIDSRLAREILRWRFLRNSCSYRFGESRAQPGLREFGLSWQVQPPDRPSFEEALDRSVQTWISGLLAEDDGQDIEFFADLRAMARIAGFEVAS